MKPNQMKKIVDLHFKLGQPMLLIELRKKYGEKWAGSHKGRLKCLRILDDGVKRARKAVAV